MYRANKKAIVQNTQSLLNIISARVYLGGRVILHTRKPVRMASNDDIKNISPVLKAALPVAIGPTTNNIAVSMKRIEKVIKHSPHLMFSMFFLISFSIFSSFSVASSVFMAKSPEIKFCLTNELVV